MGFEEMVVAIVGTIAGVGFLGFITYQITTTIKSWINRRKGGYDEETFNRLAQAFMQHKKDTEKRLKNLEAIISKKDASPKTKEFSEPQETIEIKDDESQQEQGRESGDSKLRNMLKN